MQTRFQVHGWVRLGIGVTLITVAAWMVLSGHDLGWGLSYSVVVPACILMFPGLALVKRKVLYVQENTAASADVSVDVETGWMWRHGRRLNLTDCRLELMQMAGLWAVIVHRSVNDVECEIPLITWVRRSQAEAAMCFLDQVAPDGQWPRVQREQAQWDR